MLSKSQKINMKVIQYTVKYAKNCIFVNIKYNLLVFMYIAILFMSSWVI